MTPRRGSSVHDLSAAIQIPAAGGTVDRIPNRIHFIFGLQPDFGGKPFSFVHFLAVLSATIVNQPKEVVLHYCYEPTGVWWEQAKPFVVLSRVAVPNSVEGRSISHFAHKADVLRLDILHSEGGIYLDADTFCIRSFSPLLAHPAVMGIEPNAGLCNAVVLAERNSQFIRTWRIGYGDFSDHDWRSHSVRLPYFIAREHPELIHVESEYSFFFPTYDDPMHTLLWGEEMRLTTRIVGMLRILSNALYYARGDWPVRIFSYLWHLVSSSDWYYSRLRNSYCLHLWESIWWDAHLKSLSPHSLRRSEGLFARLVSDVVGNSVLDSLSALSKSSAV